MESTLSPVTVVVHSPVAGIIREVCSSWLGKREGRPDGGERKQSNILHERSFDCSSSQEEAGDQDIGPPASKIGFKADTDDVCGIGVRCIGDPLATKEYNERLFSAIIKTPVTFSPLCLVPSIAGRALVAKFIVEVLLDGGGVGVASEASPFRVADIGCGPYVVMEKLVSFVCSQYTCGESLTNKRGDRKVSFVNVERDHLAASRASAASDFTVVDSSDMRSTGICYIAGVVSGHFHVVFSNPPFGVGPMGMAAPHERNTDNGQYGSIISLIGESRIIGRHAGHWCVMVPKTSGLYPAIKSVLRGLRYIRLVTLTDESMTTECNVLIWSTHLCDPVVCTELQ